jgi:hypothetical protein
MALTWIYVDTVASGGTAEEMKKIMDALVAKVPEDKRGTEHIRYVEDCGWEVSWE